jgi:hypothetical protein
MNTRALKEEEIDEGESEKEKRTSFTVHFETPALQPALALVPKTFKAINASRISRDCRA